MNKAFRLSNKILNANVKLGLAISPETRLSYLPDILEKVDKMTIMTVEPGFSGGEFLPEMFDKIQEACELREKYGYHYLVEIDGSCNAKTFGKLKEKGADAFVVGTSGLFGLDQDISCAWEKMMEDLR